MHSDRTNDGRKLGSSEKEALRKRAVQQIKADESPEAVADTYGINRRTVYRWLERYYHGGHEGLTTQPKSGRPTKFTADDLRWLSRTIRGSSNFPLRCGRDGSCAICCAVSVACASRMSRSGAFCASLV